MRCQGDEALFMETALALGDARSHAAVEALPLPPKAASKVHPASLQRVLCPAVRWEELGEQAQTLSLPDYSSLASSR